MARRSGEETRELILRTGMAMLLSRGVSAPVRHIRLQEVVRHAGLTTGAAYRLWADQDAFHRDLATRVTRHRDRHPATDVRALIAADPKLGLPEVIRRAAEAHVRALQGEAQRQDQFLVTLAVRASARAWDELAQASADRHEESLAAFEEVYRDLMDRHGWQMRSPFTTRDFAVAVAALAEGFAVQAVEGVEHPVCEARGACGEASLPGGPWTLLGVAVRALVREMMVETAPWAP